MKEQKHERTKMGRGPGVAAAVLLMMCGVGLIAGSGSCGSGDKPKDPGSTIEVINPEGLELDPAPGALVREYYQAVNHKDSDAACAMRSSCSDTDKDSIVSHFGIELVRMTVLWSEPASANYLAEGVETHSDGAKTGWKDYLLLARAGDSWMIQAIGASPTRAPAETRAPDPEQVIRDYYQALDQKDLERFCALRLDCAERFQHSLMRHQGMTLESAALKSKDNDVAVVSTESLESFDDGTKVRWKQDWWLRLVSGEWKIDQSGNVEFTEIGPEGGSAAQGPEAVMKEYYKALDENDVSQACAMRKTCSEVNKRSVKNHKPISLIKSELTSSESGRAVVHTESVEINDDGSRWRWNQDWFLLEDGNRWLIETTDNAVFKKE